MADALGRLRSLLRRSRPRPAILMYHRVARLERDPWGLAVSPEQFRAHLDHLVAHRTVLGADEFVARGRRGALPEDAVAITFDDGYRDNRLNAEPLLAEAGLQATLFVTTGAIGSGRPYWWDELGELVFGCAREGPVEVGSGAGRIVVDLGPSSAGAGSAGWRAWHRPAGQRERAYTDLWSRLRALPPEAREDGLAELRAALPGPVPAFSDLPMTAEELADLHARGTFRLGGHTVHHPHLPDLSEAARQREIGEGKRIVEALAGEAVAGFAYPHGAVDADTRRAVAEAGFAWAMTTDAAPVDPGAFDRFMLPRLAAPSVGAAGLAMLLASRTR